MFLDIGFPEMLLILVAALFIFGPDRLPEMAAKAGRLVRELRGMAAGAKADLTQAIGPELADLTELRKLGRLDLDLLGDLDPRRQISDAVRSADPTQSAPPQTNGSGPAPASGQPRFDADAT